MVHFSHMTYSKGKVLDFDYQRIAKKHNKPVDKSKDHNLATFPIEEARLASLKPSLFICCLLIIGYGWCLENRVASSSPFEEF